MNFLLNFIHNSKVKRTFIILILLFVFILISAISYVDAVSEDISDSVFRLHVIANSDSEIELELSYGDGFDTIDEAFIILDFPRE